MPIKPKESIAKLNEPLLKAVMENDEQAVRAALKEGADINAADNDDNTALHLIAKKCEPQDLKVLGFLLDYKWEHESERNLEHKADVLWLNKEGQSALSIAEEKDKSADVQAETIRKRLRDSVQAELSAAIEAADVDLLRRAIKAGAKVDETHTTLVVVELQKRERDSAASVSPSKGSVWSRFFSLFFDSEKPSTVPAVKVPKQGDELQTLQQLKSDLWARRLLQALRPETRDITTPINTLIFSKANPLHDDEIKVAVLRPLNDGDAPTARVLTAGILCRVLEVEHDKPWTRVEAMYKACIESLKARLEIEAKAREAAAAKAAAEKAKAKAKPAASGAAARGQAGTAAPRKTPRTAAKNFNVTQPVIGNLSMLRLVQRLLPDDSAAEAAAGAAGAAADHDKPHDKPLFLLLRELRNALQTATNRALGLAVEELNVEEVTAALRAGAQWREAAASAEGGGGAAAQTSNHLITAKERKNALEEEKEKLDRDIAKKEAAIAKAERGVEDARGELQSAIDGAPETTLILAWTLSEKAEDAKVTAEAAAEAAAEEKKEAEKALAAAVKKAVDAETAKITAWEAEWEAERVAEEKAKTAARVATAAGAAAEEEGESHDLALRALFGSRMKEKKAAPKEQSPKEQTAEKVAARAAAAAKAAEKIAEKADAEKAAAEEVAARAAAAAGAAKTVAEEAASKAAAALRAASGAAASSAASGAGAGAASSAASGAEAASGAGAGAAGAAAKAAASPPVSAGARARARAKEREIARTREIARARAGAGAAARQEKQPERPQTGKEKRAAARKAEAEQAQKEAAKKEAAAKAAAEKTKKEAAEKARKEAVAAEVKAKRNTLSRLLNRLRIWLRGLRRVYFNKSIQVATKTLKIKQKKLDEVLAGKQGSASRSKETLEKERRNNSVQLESVQEIVGALQRAGANDLLVCAKTLDAVREALKAGADVDAVDVGGLYHALKKEGNDRFNFIKLLIQYGADPDKLNVAPQSKEIQSLLNTGKLWRALQEGNVGEAEKMLRQGADVSLTHIDAEENTALKYAMHAPEHQQELVELLIKYGANPLQQTDKGRDAVIQQNRGRDRSRQLNPNKSLRLFDFAEALSLDDISSLLHVGSLFYMLRGLGDDAERECHLSNITKGGRGDGGAIKKTHHITLCNSDGQSPLQLAVNLQEKNPDAAYYKGVIAPLQDKTNAALMKAVVDNDEAAVRAAVKAGAKIDKKVINALLAKERPDQENIMWYVLDAGLSLLGGDKSPLRLVLGLSRGDESMRGKLLLIRTTLQRATNQNLLQATNVTDARAALDAGADICVVDAEGKYALRRSGAGADAGGDAEQAALLDFLREKTQEALHTAIENADVERIQDVKAAGADVNRALHHVVVAKGKDLSEEKRLAIFKSFVEGGADIHAHRGKSNKTIFIDAVRCGRVGIVKYLIEQGVNVLAAGVDGNTALHYVARQICQRPADDENLILIARAIIGAKPEALKAKNGAQEIPESIAPVVATYSTIQRVEAGLFSRRRPAAGVAAPTPEGSGAGAAAAAEAREAAGAGAFRP